MLNKGEKAFIGHTKTPFPVYSVTSLGTFRSCLWIVYVEKTSREQLLQAPTDPAVKQRMWLSEGKLKAATMIYTKTKKATEWIVTV